MIYTLFFPRSLFPCLNPSRVNTPPPSSKNSITPQLWKETERARTGIKSFPRCLSNFGRKSHASLRETTTVAAAVGGIGDSFRARFIAPRKRVENEIFVTLYGWRDRGSVSRLSQLTSLLIHRGRFIAVKLNEKIPARFLPLFQPLFVRLNRCANRVSSVLYMQICKIESFSFIYIYKSVGFFSSISLIFFLTFLFFFRILQSTIYQQIYIKLGKSWKWKIKY